MKHVSNIALAIAISATSNFALAATFLPQDVGQKTAQTVGEAPGDKSAAVKEQAVPVPVALTEGKAKLSPENTRVNFVGTHVGDKPDPRLGGFRKFTGELTMNDESSHITGLTLEFEIDSIWTEIGDKLTDHLKNADFFDVEKYPTAKFVSKKVSAGEKGGLDIVGDFTLMDKTNEVTIPVTLTKVDSGVLVTGELTLDRAIFGMNKMLDHVSGEVAITLSIGEKTKAATATASQGGFDMDAFFKSQDADGDGKLTGAEIPARMQGNLDRIDTNKDGSVTMEELKVAFAGRGQ